MKKIRQIFSLEIVKFIIVGVINTSVSMIIMFTLYNGFNVSDTISTFIAYVVGSIVSFVLNRTYTFKSDAEVGKSLIRFSVNVAVCYTIAYIILRPGIKALISFMTSNITIIDNITMFLGAVIFTGCNYFGQKFFAFKVRSSK